MRHGDVLDAGERQVDAADADALLLGAAPQPLRLADKVKPVDIVLPRMGQLDDLHAGLGEVRERLRVGTSVEAGGHSELPIAAICHGHDPSGFSLFEGIIL